MFSFCSTTIPGYPTPLLKKGFEQKEAAVTCEHVIELIKQHDCLQCHDLQIQLCRDRKRRAVNGVHTETSARKG